MYTIDKQYANIFVEDFHALDAFDGYYSERKLFLDNLKNYLITPCCKNTLLFNNFKYKWIIVNKVWFGFLSLCDEIFKMEEGKIVEK